MNYAAVKRAYRSRAKAAGKLRSMFERARFVGVDGEGFNTPETVTVEMGNPAHTYEAPDHEYALLTDSDGEELYDASGRLDTKRCLDFLLNIKLRDRDAVPVVFGGSYDICHMLAFGLSGETIAALLARDETGLKPEPRIDVTLGEHDYRLMYRPRKQFTIARWAAGAEKYERYEKRDGTRAWRRTPCDTVTLWDVWGFFQGSFVDAMDKWLPNDPDWQMIKRLKGKRKDFNRSEIDTIRKYNAAEVRCLAAMMDAVRASIRATGLEVTRWDGVGAVASAMFRKHDVRAHMAEADDYSFNAARIAYSGGHIEACMVGHHDKGVFHYDVTSAYPDKFRHLPSLSGGVWTRGQGIAPVEGFTLVRLSFRFLPGLPFYPLFFRCGNGQILFPERGCGWYWFAEYAVARDFADRFGAFEFRVMEWLTYRVASNVRPFAWIEQYFDRRATLVDEANRAGVVNGEEKTLKLGYNACYGKTAQQLGARIADGEIIPPAYFQMEWSGYVTAGCRAQLMSAALQSPGTIIGFATDAVFSMEPLALDCPPKKTLGAWEFKKHTGMTMVMPGVYWLHDDDKVEHHSRGYDKDQMGDVSIVHEAWRRGQSSLDLTHTRMVTLGNATMSEGFWKLRGLFANTTRRLKLNGENSKRHGVAMTRAALHKEMVPTRPRDHDEDYTLACESLMSAPFPIKFMDGEQHDDNKMAGDGHSFFVNAGDPLDAYEGR